MKTVTNHRSRWALHSALGVAAALTLAACATPTSPVAPSSARPSATPSATAFAHGLSANGNVPAVLDPEILSVFSVQAATLDTYSDRVYAAWPQFGKPAVDATISAYYRKQVSDFTGSLPKDQKDAPQPELNLDWHVVGASTNMVGIVADEYRFVGASGQDSWHTFWLDPTTDQVFSTSALANDDATNAVLKTAAAARKSSVSSIDLSQAGADPFGAASLVGFSKAGELIVGFDECQVAACYEGPITLTIDKATTDGLLTDIGRRAQAATMNPLGSATASPSASPSRSPQPSPSSTATKPAPKPTPSGKKVDCHKLKCIAITFDDGPGPYTMKLLSYLKAKDVKATFFELGQQVDLYPKVTKAVAAGGHEIGVHTWDHRALNRLSASQIDSELSSTIQIIRKETGVTPTLLRPPYGSMNATVKVEAKKYGLAIALWNVDTLDWKTRSTPKTVAAALKDTRRGSIILLHDIHKTSVAAVPAIIDGLRAKGYTFVTVSQMIPNAKPGQKYFSGPTK